MKHSICRTTIRVVASLSLLGLILINVAIFIFFIAAVIKITGYAHYPWFDSNVFSVFGTPLEIAFWGSLMMIFAYGFRMFTIKMAIKGHMC